MSRNSIVGIVTVSVAIVSLAFFLYIRQFVPKYNWKVTYNENSQEPYGAAVFYQLLEARSTKLIHVKSGLEARLKADTAASNYMFYGNHSYLDSTSITHLFDYIEKGNNAFLITEENPNYILKRIMAEEFSWYFYSFYEDSTIAIDFSQKLETDTSVFEFHYKYLDGLQSRYWSCIPENYFQDTLTGQGLEALSMIKDGGVNFYRVTYGKGTLFIHCNPILFTNYNLKDEQGFILACKVLEHLNDGPILWDRMPEVQSGDNQTQKTNPLQFVFSHYTLKWGWYCLLIMTGLYLIFRAKREQRIIPVRVPNSNSSIAFVQAVGILYFQDQNHKIIANELNEIFLMRIGSRYNIPKQVKEAELKQLLYDRSGVSQQIIDMIIDGFFKMRYNPIARASDLERLHTALNQFYLNRK